MERLEVPAMLYSEREEKDAGEAEVLVIDNIGMLSSLYAYGDAAYIGGGFGSGIHNVLEAAVYGIPVLFGPRYGKFREAVDLIGLGGAFAIEDEAGLEQRLNGFYDDVAMRKEAGAKAGNYVKASAGSTARIVNNLLTFFRS
jgi:3-deoxy-D-manno-octulosonic-acid transferase